MGGTHEWIAKSTPNPSQSSRSQRTGVSRKQRVPQQQLRSDAASAPHVDRARILSRPEDQLGRPVVPAADVRDAGLAGQQRLGRAEVAQLQHMPATAVGMVWSRCGDETAVS